MLRMYLLQNWFSLSDIFRLNCFTLQPCVPAVSKYQRLAVSSPTRSEVRMCDQLRFCKRVCKISGLGIVR
ncbi:MAG: hypothetical protein LUG24_04575 [Clostridiales bacterium]|nr:hypothetical protein [Clostridiales bacterium]